MCGLISTIKMLECLSQIHFNESLTKSSYAHKHSLLHENNILVFMFSLTMFSRFTFYFILNIKVLNFSAQSSVTVS